MSTVIDSMCLCDSIGASGVRLCGEHHRYFNGDKRLASVSQIIRAMWPAPDRLPPDDVLENARLRGCQVDALFSAYVVGKLSKIPAGTRTDAKDLFLKLVAWFKTQGFKDCQSQILLADGEIAGTCDLKLDGMIIDLKTVYDVSPTHVLQVGAYLDLDMAMGHIPSGAAVLHVTERYAEPKLIPLDIKEVVADWRSLRACWSMIQRRAGKPRS